VLATADDREARHLASLGATLEPVSFNRGGFAPGADWRAWRRMRQIYQRWQPSLAHHFHAKPVMLGTLAARKARGSSVGVINTVTGLGHAFIRGGLAARLAGVGYSAALPRADITVFQNRDDRALFLKMGWLNEDRTRLIAGSGVDLERFLYLDRPANGAKAPTVVMLGRLIRQKGIPEFLEVSRRVRGRFPTARFLLAGEEDPVHPDAVSAEWVRSQEGIEYLGRLDDVVPLLREADLFLFPSYREGVPRAVMEAAATGLPTVAFDVPGVREAVRDGQTGYLVPDRDVDALHGRVLELLEHEEKRMGMGRAARQLAEEAFDIKAIQEAYRSLYRQLGATA